MRISYRLHQFWRSLTQNHNSSEDERLTSILNPSQAGLFDQLQPAEKAHALELARRLDGQGDTSSDLLVAALLHDIGKLRYRLNPFERGLVVIVGAAWPRLARRLGSLSTSGWESLPGWRKAFVVSQHHAEWGAVMARQAGVSLITEKLIRWHHQQASPGVDSNEASLLHKLWVVDNES